MIEEAINIIEKIKEKITPGSDMIWTFFETPEELANELNDRIAELKQNDITHLDDLYIHFLPTCTLQEHSMMNGWSEEYMLLANRFDVIYEAIKKNDYLFKIQKRQQD